jgi:hypothetical protein
VRGFRSTMDKTDSTAGCTAEKQWTRRLAVEERLLQRAEIFE